MSSDMALPLRVASSHSMPALLITLCSCAEQAHSAQTCVTCIWNDASIWSHSCAPNALMQSSSYCQMSTGSKACHQTSRIVRCAKWLRVEEAAPWTACAHSVEVGAVAPGQALSLAMRLAEGLHSLVSVLHLHLVLLMRRAGSGCKARGGLYPPQGLHTHVAHLIPVAAEQPWRQQQHLQQQHSPLIQ